MAQQQQLQRAQLQQSLPPPGSFRYNAGLAWERHQQLVMQHECRETLEEVLSTAGRCYEQHYNDVTAMDKCLVAPVSLLQQCVLRTCVLLFPY